MLWSISAFLTDRRYQVLTPMEKIQEILLGSIGATMMITAALFGIMLALVASGQSDRSRHGWYLLVTSIVLLILRAFSRGMNESMPPSALSFDTVAAAITGSLFIGLPALIVGFVAGSTVGSFVISQGPALLEASMGSYPQLGAALDLGIAVSFGCFGVFPQEAVILCLLFGLVRGAAARIETELGVHFAVRNRDVLRLVQMVFCLGLVAIVVADGSRSFEGWLHVIRV